MSEEDNKAAAGGSGLVFWYRNKGSWFSSLVHHPVWWSWPLQLHPPPSCHALLPPLCVRNTHSIMNPAPIADALVSVPCSRTRFKNLRGCPFSPHLWLCWFFLFKEKGCLLGRHCVSWKMDDLPMFYAARCPPPPPLDCIQVSFLLLQPTPPSFSGVEYRNTYFSLTHFCSECPLGAQFCSPHMLYYLRVL